MLRSETVPECCIVCLCLTGSDWSVSQKQSEVICLLFVFRLVCVIFKKLYLRELCVLSVVCLLSLTLPVAFYCRKRMTSHAQIATWLLCIYCDGEHFYATADKLKLDMRFYSWLLGFAWLFIFFNEDNALRRLWFSIYECFFNFAYKMFFFLFFYFIICNL